MTAGDGQGQPRDLERRPRLAARARLARTAGKDALVDRRLRIYGGNDRCNRTGTCASALPAHPEMAA